MESDSPYSFRANVFDTNWGTIDKYARLEHTPVQHLMESIVSLGYGQHNHTQITYTFINTATRLVQTPLIRQHVSCKTTPVRSLCMDLTIIMNEIFTRSFPVRTLTGTMPGSPDNL